MTTTQPATETAAPPPNRRGRRWLTVLLSVIAVALVVGYFAGREEGLAETFALLRPEVLLAGMLVYWLYMALRTLRMRVLLGEHAPRFRRLFYLQCLTGGLGTVSPARAGEAVKIAWLHRSHAVPLERAVLAYAVEKSQDVGFYAAAALVTVWVLGSLDLVPEWLRGWFLPVLTLLVVAGALVLLVHLWRGAQRLGHIGAVLLSSALVFCGTFASCYVVFALHGLYHVGHALAVYSLTVIAGTLSMLPGGGQGVVQWVFHGAATELFAIDEQVTTSMVLHITLNFYLGVASSIALALWWKPGTPAEPAAPQSS